MTAVNGRESALVTVVSGADALVWQVGHPWVRSDTLGGAAATCQEGCESRGSSWPVLVSEVVEVRALPTDVFGKTLGIAFAAALVIALGAAVASMDTGGL